ncbi:UPF0555 protein isogeny family [Arachis hypogaea]|nr:UPF0555 protein isogeny family [Arachis hypogaea]
MLTTAATSTPQSHSSFMKDICDRVVKELETLGVSGSFGSKMSDDLQVINGVKGYDSKRLNESNENGK